MLNCEGISVLKATFQQVVTLITLKKREKLRARNLKGGGGGGSSWVVQGTGCEEKIKRKPKKSSFTTIGLCNKKVLLEVKEQQQTSTESDWAEWSPFLDGRSGWRWGRPWPRRSGGRCPTWAESPACPHSLCLERRRRSFGIVRKLEL